MTYVEDNTLMGGLVNLLSFVLSDVKRHQKYFTTHHEFLGALVLSGLLQNFPVTEGRKVAIDFFGPLFSEHLTGTARPEPYGEWLKQYCAVTPADKIISKLESLLRTLESNQYHA